MFPPLFSPSSSVPPCKDTEGELKKKKKPTDGNWIRTVDRSQLVTRGTAKVAAAPRLRQRESFKRFYPSNFRERLAGRVEEQGIEGGGDRRMNRDERKGKRELEDRLYCANVTI